MLPTTAKNKFARPPNTECTPSTSDHSNFSTEQTDAAMTRSKPLAASRALQDIIRNGPPSDATSPRTSSTFKISITTDSAIDHEMQSNASLMSPFPAEDNNISVGNTQHSYIIGYYLQPTRLTSTNTVNFELSPSTLLAHTSGKNNFVISPEQHCSQQIIRVRCCEIDQKHKDLMKIWPTTEGTWPKSQEIILNAGFLRQPQAKQNAKDAGASCVMLEHYMLVGDNKLAMTKSSKKKDKSYVVAVETINIASRRDIIGNIAMLPQEETRKAIVAKQSRPANDDGIEVLAGGLTISLIDPYSGSSCTTPVRTKRCLHLECFDLDNFLSQHIADDPPALSTTRWRCPICRMDARPPLLVQDGYITTILRDLKRSGTIDSVHAVECDAKGDWSVKKQKRKSDANDQADVDGRPAKRREILEIIEID